MQSEQNLTSDARTGSLIPIIAALWKADASSKCVFYGFKVLPGLPGLGGGASLVIPRPRAGEIKG